MKFLAIAATLLLSGCSGISYVEPDRYCLIYYSDARTEVVIEVTDEVTKVTTKESITYEGECALYESNLWSEW